MIDYSTNALLQGVHAAYFLMAALEGAKIVTFERDTSFRRELMSDWVFTSFTNAVYLLACNRRQNLSGCEALTVTAGTR